MKNNIFCLQVAISTINNYISQNISNLIYDILIEYKYLNKEDQDIQYINKYVEHYIFKNNSEIIDLLIDKLITENNILKNCLGELHSSILIIKDIMKFKNDNIDSFITYYNKTLQNNEKKWRYMRKEYKELFINEKEYIKGCILSDIYAYPDSLNSNVPSEIKEFFLHCKNNSATNNEKVENIQKSIIKNILNYTKLDQEASKKHNEDYIKHISTIQIIDNYINKQLILPIILKIQSVFDTKKKIDVNCMNEYILLNYNFNSSLYYYIFFREYLFQQEQVNEDLIKAITEIIYIELLHDNSKLIISRLSSTKSLAKSNFHSLDKDMQSLYKNEEIYNKLLMVKNYNLNSSKQTIEIVIKESKKALSNSFNFIKKDKSNNNYYYNLLSKIVNKIYENKEIISIGLLLMYISNFKSLGTMYTIFNTIRQYVYDLNSFYHIKELVVQELNKLIDENNDDDIEEKDKLNYLSNKNLSDSKRK